MRPFRAETGLKDNNTVEIRKARRAVWDLAEKHLLPQAAEVRFNTTKKQGSYSHERL